MTHLMRPFRDEGAKLDELYAKALVSAQEKDPRIKHNVGPTADQIAKEIYDALPEFHEMLFRSRHGLRLGHHDSVFVTYASVPKGSAEIDALNARSAPKIFINEAPGHIWFVAHNSPPKVVVEHTSGQIGMDRNYVSKIKLRKKTTTPEGAVRYIVDFFKKNADVLLSNERP